MIERPRGGFSFVLADGQGHGEAARFLSHLVATKAVTLLAEGVRDSAAARATHDFLYAYREGKVSAELTIVSVDLISKTVVLSRNTHCPLIISVDGDVRSIDEPCQVIGLYARTKPAVTEIPLSANLAIVVMSDGALDAGRRSGRQMDIVATVRSLIACPPVARTIADGVLAQAMALDDGRPLDDTSVLVVTTRTEEREDGVRRLHLSFPI